MLKPYYQKLRIRYPEILTSFPGSFTTVSLHWAKDSGCTKLREFQFKILHRILTTNYSLYKMSLVPSPVCSFCDNNDQSLRHLLVHCSFVSVFWDQILNWNFICRNYFDNLDDISILFGIPSTGETEGSYLILNTILLVGKQTIYQCRKNLIKLSLALFLAKIDHLKSLEYQIAKKRGKLVTYFDKWKNVLL